MKLRIKFTKHGALRYIGHLDIQRYFQRLNRRAGLNMIYTEGFSPHQKMSFAMPLSVGYESDAEYFDIEVYSAGSSKTVIDSMNANQADGITVTGCVLLPEKAQNAMASVRAADYTVRFRKGYEPDFDIRNAIDRFNESDEFIIKKINKKANKKKNRRENSSQDNVTYKEIDLKQYVHTLEYPDEGTVFMRVSAGSADNVKPELVVNALYEREDKVPDPMALKITRTELYTDDLKPLIEVGSVF
ncbi:MAG: TIGR03936 family radical SAM-associated protein [Lachnospiraceae bacterium]|nr:TIGR03936 family radical SAM-associated protein [Lachnospiraceae bacterium]